MYQLNPDCVIVTSINLVRGKLFLRQEVDSRKFLCNPRVVFIPEHIFLLLVPTCDHWRLCKSHSAVKKGTQRDDNTSISLVGRWHLRMHCGDIVYYDVSVITAKCMWMNEKGKGKMNFRTAVSPPTHKPIPLPSFPVSLLLYLLFPH